MNVSALPVVLVPPGVVTCTSTVPAACAGAVAVQDVAEQDTPVAALPPKVIAVAPVRFVPVTVTAVPPATGPLFGVTAVISGAGTVCRDRLRGPVTPAAVVTVLVAVSMA